MTGRERETKSPWVISNSDTVHRRTCKRYARVRPWPWVGSEGTFEEPAEHEILGHLVGDQKTCGFCLKDLGGQIERTDEALEDVRRARGLLNGRGRSGDLVDQANLVLGARCLDREAVVNLAAELVAVLEWL